MRVQKVILTVHINGERAFFLLVLDILSHINEAVIAKARSVKVSDWKREKELTDNNPLL